MHMKVKKKEKEIVKNTFIIQTKIFSQKKKRKRICRLVNIVINTN